MSPMLALLLALLALLFGVLRSRKRRHGEPPLVNGWIPHVGKALEFGKDARQFLEDHRKKLGDIFTVHIAGRYMTFIMDPLLYPRVIKQGRQLDFHEFSSKTAPAIFGYRPVALFPGLDEKVHRSFQLLQGDHLGNLTDSMIGNLMLVFRLDHLNLAGWTSSGLYDFCYSVMFEATVLTIYGRSAANGRHEGMEELRRDFVRFDAMFPLLAARVPLCLLGRTKWTRDRLLRWFLPNRVHSWQNTSKFIQYRREVLDQFERLTDVDKAAHHFTILWASVANTTPATFWTVFHLLTHPEALAMVRQEVQQVLERSGIQFHHDMDVALTRDQLDQMLLLDSSIRESLRLVSASMNIRLVMEDLTLQVSSQRSINVRKGDVIALYPPSLHMDPNIYEDPEAFRYDRFLEVEGQKPVFHKDGQKLKYFLMPFGSGASKCPGRHFAVNEIKQFVALLLLYFDLTPEQPGCPHPYPDPQRAGIGVLQPNVDFRFRLRCRP
ncbi:cytochrome P450 7B1 [Synchiropus splendidus]|uniref:cytochrome P450 7B1 n=1 Tax=Synchiropus splendidus TaxID=270530 RepID=UPI00237E7BF8|nr:cytochrome P450 7B1 [Synchiropus splendidus]